jgi:hypothetical protein
MNANANIIEQGKHWRDIGMNKRAASATKHGMSRTRAYRAWTAMKRRCDSPDSRLARWYTEIQYDPKWATFEGFWEDMKFGYADHLTLDRIDSSKDYSKENCRWATMKEQSRNRKDNVFLPYNGKMLCVSDYAEKVGLPRSLIYQRVKRGESLSMIGRPSRKTRNAA